MLLQRMSQHAQQQRNAAGTAAERSAGRLTFRLHGSSGLSLLLALALSAALHVSAALSNGLGAPGCA
jgi:hypothetical protein